jgi:prepilin-type N-terminal cleavage/methylation domain-containing protein
MFENKDGFIAIEVIIVIVIIAILVVATIPK